MEHEPQIAAQQQAAAQAAAAQQAAAQAAAEAAAAAAAQQQLEHLILQRMQQNLGPIIDTALAQREAARLARDTVKARFPKPDTFSGDRSGKENVEEWLFVASTYLTACGVTADLDRLTIATGYLRGAALTWWRRINQPGAPNRISTWDGFCNGMRHTFQPINPAETARDKLAGLRQITTVRQYATLIRNTALDIPSITDDELKDRFIRNLKPATRTEVRMRNPASFEQAVELAERYDAMRYNFPRSRQTIPFGNGNGPSPMELGAMTDSRSRPNGNNGNGQRRPKLDPALQKQLIKEGKCFYCRQPGHLAINCPEKKKQQQRTKQ